MDEEKPLRGADETGLIDPFLQIVVSSINKHGTPYPVSFQIGGVIISGLLISKKEYFRWWDEFKAAPEGETVTEHPMSELLFPKEGDEPAEDDAEKPLPKFFHLKDAVLSPPGQPSTHMKGQVWRGKLSAVDAWFPHEIRATVGEPPVTR